MAGMTEVKDEAVDAAGGAAVGGTGAGAATPGDELAARLLARIEDRSARVLIVGQGYVGLPVAMRAVEQGFGVTGLELSAPRVAALRARTSYVGDISDEVLRRGL
jgi:hypothetical protein